jgi:hypothetical protein
MIEYVYAMGMFMAVYAGPQVYAGESVSDLNRCWINVKCTFDWRQYDALIPALEAMHPRKGFWKDWRRSTNVEIAGQGRYQP